MSDRILDDAREAFLFVNSDRTLNAVSLHRDGRDLPQTGESQWRFEREFPLGVHEATPFGLDPEPILRGIASDGYFVWPVEHVQPFGTSQ